MSCNRMASFAESRACEVVVVVAVELEDCFVEGVQFADSARCSFLMNAYIRSRIV